MRIPRQVQIAFLVVCGIFMVQGFDYPASGAEDVKTLTEGEAPEDMSVMTLPEVVVSETRMRSYRGASRIEVSSNAAALPAPSTILDPGDIQRTPIIQNYVDLFRPLPGIDVSNYGQGGLGNGISIRGFTDLEHGRDMSYYIDGIPINEVSSVHTPNYADLNILVPETIERLEVVRGPFSALYGDSNLGGSVNIITKRFDSVGQVKGYGGYFNTGRGVVTYSRPRGKEGSIIPYLAAETYTTDGYRDNQGYKRYNLFAKATAPTRFGDFTFRTQFYGGEWGAPGYLNRNLVESGMVSPKAAVNSTDGGHKDFQNAVVNYALGEVDQVLTVTGFINHDVFVRYADFGGGQRVQEEDRTTTGLTIRKVWTSQIFDRMPAQLMIGTNFRNDSVGLSQGPTLLRNPNGPLTRDMSYTEQGWGQYVQAQVQPVPWLKLIGGGRYDHFWYDIDNHLGNMSVPQVDTGTLNPKAGVVIQPVPWLEVFANYGEGFRSPSAVTDVATSTGIKPLKLRSQEVGIQIQPSPRLRFLADVWSTTVNQEIFQSAAGLDPQNLGRSRREGYDIEARYYVRRDKEGQASLFVNYTQIRAVILDQAPATVVPNVPAYIVNIGTDVDMPVGGANTSHRAGGQFYVQFIGKKNLTEDGVLTTKPYQRVSGRVFYAHASGWMGFADMIWYPTNRLSETAVNFGNPTGASSSDIYVGPQAPFQAVVGATYHFKTGV